MSAPEQPDLVHWLAALRTLSAAATSGTDPQSVLSEVAATARSLLHFDFCGVLTPDAKRESLLIAGWSGLSADYVGRINSDRPVRLDSTAPSSRAFHTGRPVAIHDITAESGFAPWGGVAREQGYRAIVCVPLIAGDDVLGTLNGYYRPEHVFADEDIERLTLLANHAAIALTSARRLDELHRLTTSLVEQRDALRRSEQIHERLLAVALRSGGLDGIATTLADLVGRSVRIEDARGEVLAASENFTEISRTADDFVSTARLDGEVAARICLPGAPEPLDPIGARAVEHASLVVSLELLRLRTAVEVEHRLRGELLAELLSGPAAMSPPLLARAELLGHQLTGPHTVLVGALGDAVTDRSSQRTLSAVADALRAHRPRPLAAMYHGDIVVLWPAGSGDAGTAATVIHKTIAAGVAGPATVARYGIGAGSFAHGYRIAKGALDIALRSGRKGTVVTLPELGVAGLLLQLEDTGQLLAFADTTLGPVLDYDRRHRTELLATLRMYLQCRLDRAATAQRLHIHPNTVGQRMRRIEQLCSAELADPSVAAQFSTALTVRDVALLPGA